MIFTFKCTIEILIKLMAGPSSRSNLMAACLLLPFISLSGHPVLFLVMPWPLLLVPHWQLVAMVSTNLYQ